MFVNNSVQNCHREPRQRLKCNLFSFLCISIHDCGRTSESFGDR